MALSSKDCRSLQVFAEHSDVCGDLISLVASVKLQFVGQARSSEVAVSNAKAVSVTHAPLGGNGGEVVVKGGDGKLRVVCVDSKKTVAEVEEGGSGSGLVGQLDGCRRIYSTSNSNIMLYDALSNWSKVNAGKADANIIQAAPHAGGSQMLITTDHTYLYDLTAQAELGVAFPPSVSSNPIATALKSITPHTFAAGFFNGVAAIIDTRAKRPPAVVTCTPNPIISISPLPKNRLAICQNQLTVWELSGTKPLQTWSCTQKHDALPEEVIVAMTPVDAQGRLIATVSNPKDRERSSILRIWSPNSHWANWLERAAGGEVIKPLKSFSVETGKPYTPLDSGSDTSSINNTSLDSIELLNGPEDGPLRSSSVTVLPDSRLVVASNTLASSRISVWV